MFYTYILHSPSKDRYYIGMSENPSERLKKHNNKHRGFTAQSDDWEIVYQKEFATKQEALFHERELKSWKSKVRIKKLIDTSK